MGDEVKKGYTTSEFGRGIAIDGAWVLLAFQSGDWRVQCCAMLAVAVSNATYNIMRSQEKTAVRVAKIEAQEPQEE